MKFFSIPTFVKTVAAAVDASLILQLLFVPLAFAISATRAQASVDTSAEPQVELSYNIDSNEFTLEVAPVTQVEYTLQYNTAQEITDGFADGGEANEDNRFVATRRAGTESSGHSVNFTVLGGDLSLTAERLNGEEFTFESEFVVENGTLTLSTVSETETEESSTLETQEPGYWSEVTLGETYVSPDNDKVTVTFTKLPTPTGDLRIKQITLSAEQMEQLGTTEAIAYEVTSSMENGTFEYDLTLPNPSGKQDVAVQYSEDGENFETAQPENFSVQTQDETSVVTLQGLDHFTIFVVVPDDIVSSDITSSLLQGWRLSKSGNANIALNTLPNGAPSSLGNQGLHLTRVGGATPVHNRSYLGYYEPDLKLNEIESISWNRYSQTGNDTYLNIFIWNGTNFGTIVYQPSVTLNTWEENTFDSSSTGITLRMGGTTQNISFADLMSTYGEYDVTNSYNGATAGMLGGIVLVSGSSSPTDPQDHFYDGITLKFAGQEEQFFDFVVEAPVQPETPVQIGYNHNVSGTQNPAQNPTMLPCTNAFTSVNAASVVWEDSNSNVNIKYQRQYAVNGGSWTGNEIYTSKNTNFRVFGSSAGTDMKVQSRVRAFYDYNSNNLVDSGELVSDWSNVCDITLDRIAPAAPQILFPNPEQNFTSQPILNDWTDVIDATGISKYRIEYIYDDGHSFAGGPYRESTISQRNHVPALNEQGGVRFRVQAIDGAGNEGAWSEFRHYYYDATAPSTPVITGFINPTLACGSITSLTNITVDWTDSVDGESGLAGYDYRIDYPLPGGGRGIWNSSFTNSQYSGSLNQGIHYITVRAKDKAGNTSAWSNVCEITSDNQAPAVPTNGQPDDEFLNTNDFWFTWSDVSDSGSPITYEFQSSRNPAQVGGVLTTDVWKSTDYPTNPQFYPLNTPTIHSTGAPNGKWYWQVRAVDAAGNTSNWSEIWDVTLDTVAPDVSITNPTNNGVVSGIVDFRGTVLDENLWRYHYTISGGVASRTVYRDTAFTNESIYSWNTALVADGEYTLKLEARDKANNKDAGSVATIKVRVDNTAPAAPTGLKFMLPGGETELACGDITTIRTVYPTWNANTESDFSHYEYTSFNAPNGSIGLNEAVMYTNLFVHSWVPPMDGTYGFAVRSVDTAGNKSEWSIGGKSLEGSCQITHDSVAPTAVITSHTDGQVLLDAGIATVSGVVSDDRKLSEYTFEIRDALNTLVAGPGTVSTDLTAQSVSFLWDTDAVAEGLYTIFLSAIDAAGNSDSSSSAQINVTVQRTPPATPAPEVLGASSTGSGGSSSNPGPASPPVCSAAVPGSINGLSIVTTATGATLTWNRPAGSLTNYAMEFVRLDAAGNETGRYGVDRFGNADTTSFTINNLPGGSAYRFELFAVNDCAPGARSIVTSGVITAPGVEIGTGGVTITPDQGQGAVLGSSTDEEVANADELAQEGEIGSSSTNAILSGVLGASTENCTTQAWWWILLPAFLALLVLIRVTLTGRNRAVAHVLLAGATGFGLFQSMCNPWVWTGAVVLTTLVSEVLARRAEKAAKPFPKLKTLKK